ncbi:hypothetical protein DVB69_04865 [Sporosarcina sp. BI001-red]|uniref:hypothetical protein n=1 Tax=Sporosarcina sp. BI001-red TaxID=2282866 RepID=UPI000E268C75|nr:hypothetical protein [Sporosarcina sp. BI001-red]REB10139.1 hypothetical protein DVB69_04865 [Sporosarcina sp. BI001-red]
MDELKRRLRKELEQSFDSKILADQSWSFPAHKVLISYTTVTKTKMDVLMKMILMSVQQLRIERPEELAHLLGVELLFVEDLLSIMKGAGLVVNKDVWSITELGVAQVTTGMLLHETETEETMLVVSPLHNEFLDGEKSLSLQENLEPFRYDENLSKWSTDDISSELLQTELSALVENDNTSERQRVVEQLLKVEKIEQIQIPCFEFHIHNTNQDTLYARIWNTSTEQWDETLEQLVMTKERSSWRERYLTKEEEIHHET